MSLKSVALVAAAVAVMAMGVYLFIQVKATPAEAHHASTSARPSRVPERTAEADPAPAPAPTATRPQPAAARPDVPVRATPDVAASGSVAEADERRPNLKLDSLMELANKAYDRQDFDEAIAIASKVLEKDPANVRMLRVMVSANCIGGDSAIAQQYYVKLPAFDRGQMKTRCDRYGVTLTDPPQ